MAAPTASEILPRSAAGRHATGRARPSRGGGFAAMVARQGTPATIQALIALMVVLSFAWGAFGAWAVSDHASAASSLAHADEPYSYDAQQLYLALADADVTITTSFLQDSQPVPQGTTAPSSLAARQRFRGDLIKASNYLADLRNPGGSPQFTASVAAIAGGMPDYYRDVAIAQTEYTQGITPAGDSAMEVASEDAHLTLLPNAKELYLLENNAVMASSGQATSVGTVILAFLVAIILAAILVIVQRWLTRRTNRVLNIGLVLASLALVVSALWLASAFAVARSDLSTAIGQGANPAESLAQASIDVQQIRGDSILNVIARSGSTSLSQDSATLAQQVGPGSGTLLGTASSAGNDKATAALQSAISSAPGWYSTNAQGYTLGTQYKYADEQNSVIHVADSGYGTVQGSVGNALTAAQDTFRSQADAGASAFGPVEVVVIVAALIMAGASAWGLSRRLGEYR
jgi:hypothetical protein